MSYAPRTLQNLGAYWTGHGGVMLGIVGSESHTTGYHLGRDRIYDGSGPGQGDADYSVRLDRDRAGLSAGAAAIDLGKLGGSLDELQDFSRWLVATSRAGGDIREIIYSPDGEHVQRWSGVDGQIHTGAGNGDASHRTHTHISYFRDSEQRDKVAAFAGYWRDDDMAQAAITTTEPRTITVVPVGADLLEVDGKTKAYENHVERRAVFSPYGAGSRKFGAELRRAFYLDPDGTGAKPLQLVLVWLPSTSIVPVPVPPSGTPAVLTGDDGSVYRRE